MQVVVSNETVDKTCYIRETEGAKMENNLSRPEHPNAKADASQKLIQPDKQNVNADLRREMILTELSPILPLEAYEVKQQKDSE